MNTPCRVKPDESMPVIGIMPALEVERIIKEKDSELSALRADLAAVTAERDAARVELESAKTYQRMAARR